MNCLDFSAVVGMASVMPAETIALKPPDVSEGPIPVVSFSYIDCTRVEGGFAKM